jgi:cation diffusion facilitator CzcD-associated flavoprotein CzcO
MNAINRQVRAQYIYLATGALTKPQVPNLILEGLDQVFHMYRYEK